MTFLQPLEPSASARNITSPPEPRTPNQSETSNTFENTDASTSWSQCSERVPLASSSRSVLHSPGRASSRNLKSTLTQSEFRSSRRETPAASNNSKLTSPPMNYPWLSQVTTENLPTAYLHELQSPTCERSLSVTWDASANTPPLPISAARFDNLVRARGRHASSRLSSVAFTNAVGDQVGDITSSCANYDSTSSSSPWKSTEPRDKFHQYKGIVRKAFETPNESVPSTDRTELRSSLRLKHLSEQKNNHDLKLAQRATDKLWDAMFGENDENLQETMARLGKGISDIEQRELRSRVQEDKMSKKGKYME